MEWIELIIHTTTAGSEPVSDILMESGASGTMIEDKADIPDPSKPHGIWEIIDPKLLETMPEDVLVHAWFENNAGLPSLVEKIRNRLAELSFARDEMGSLLLDTVSVNDESWKDTWKKYYKPFYAGKHLLIDIDPDAVKVAAENVQHNHVDQLVSVQQGNLLDRVSDVCDICVANIISDVIISFAAPLMSHIRPGGLFLCSGIVSVRADEVAQALTDAGYEILRRETKGEWTAFLSRRN